MRLELWLVWLGSVTSFQLGRQQVSEKTRIGSRLTTVFYVNSQTEDWNASGERSMQSAADQSKSPLSSRLQKRSPDGEDVDKYLDFLAKRYRRVHEGEISDTPTGVFSAWKWLCNGDEDHSVTSLPVPSPQKEQDALFALGLAGLASKKLLQKHHFTNRVFSDRLRQEAIDTVSTTKDVNITELGPRRLVQMIGELRRSLHDFQSVKIRSLVKTVVRAPLIIGRSLIKLGGGRYAAVTTVSLVVTLLLVLAKTMAQLVASEGANMARGA